MNIFQMRHKILEQHRGEQFTARELRAEFVKAFPAVNPGSVNAADCFNTPTKKAGCTCPECTKLGGFAVNRGGRVDMGASGFANISPVYKPTGNTRNNVTRSSFAPEPGRASMADPLSQFDWSRLYVRYDSACRRFDQSSQHLRGAYAGAPRDRDLYYKIVAAANQRNDAQLGADWYESLLYWKLYSQPAAVSNIKGWLQSFAPSTLHKFLATLPKNLSRSVQDVVALVELIGRHQIPGMKTSTALPVRTTLLHVLYPHVVPIFDQMVLKAVGAWYADANHDIGVLRRYIPRAWVLADAHAGRFPNFVETPVRLVDMALWVRGK